MNQRSENLEVSQLFLSSLRSRTDPPPASAAVFARRRLRQGSGESRSRATLDAPAKHKLDSLHPAFALLRRFFHPQLCCRSAEPNSQLSGPNHHAFQAKWSSRSQSSAGPAKFPDAWPVPFAADARNPARHKTANPVFASISQALPAKPVSPESSKIPARMEIAAAELPTRAQSPPSPETGTPPRRQSRDSPRAMPSTAISSSALAIRSKRMPRPAPPPFGYRSAGLHLPISPAAFPESPAPPPA